MPITKFFTHAWLPQNEFDEVLEKSDWVFARKDDAYLALRTNVPYRWGQADKDGGTNEIIADGNETIWICEMGRKDIDGTFDEFVESICQAEVTFDGLEVFYHSPSRGRLEFDWERPLMVEGEEINNSSYPRYDNPYMKVDFPPEKIELRFEGHHLYIDWENLIRRYH